MEFRNVVFRSALTVLATLFGTGILAAGAAGGAQPVAKNLAEQSFATSPGLPACMTTAVLSGDPGSGPALLMGKLSAGCTVPWHWHTPDEHVMLSSGVAKMEMRNAATVTLRAGGYAMMPSHHVHQFTCVSACVLFARSDGIFDTHYVDAAGKEIPPTDALKKK